MYGVTIGEKHSQKDFGLILTARVISPPVPKVNRAEVPLRDGTIDLTASLSDEVKFEDRTITLTFAVVDPIKDWSSKVSEIQNYLHGKCMKVIFDDDLAFYYYGRVSVDSWTSDRTIGKLVVKCVVEPFKYDVLSSAVDWEWDIFDFEEGIINDTGELIVNGTTTIKLICRRKRMYPIITASAAMTLTYDGEVYNLAVGSQKLYDLFLCEGENELTFTGNGTISIDYIGGSL